MDEDVRPIGERLRAVRRWRGLTQVELAGLAGVAGAAVSMWESGARPLDRRSTIAALAAALRVSETELTGGPHLGADRLQSEPHLAVPALRDAFALNSIGYPASDHARPLAEVTAALEALRPAYAAADYVRLGAPLPGLLGELYLHASDARDEGARIAAARALVDACSWAVSLCGMLRYPDLAAIAARAAVDAAMLSGDPARLGMAQFAVLGGLPRSHPHSLVMAERAASALEPYARDAESLHVLGMLTLRCALAAASVQDGARADHWLDEAQAIASRVDDSDPARNWEWFGATNVAVWRVAVAVERGESGSAVLELASGADPAKLVVKSRRAALYQDVGRGLARDRRTQGEAARWLWRAEQAAPQWIRNYAPVRETVSFLLSRARTTAGGRELRGMAARMGVPH